MTLENFNFLGKNAVMYLLQKIKTMKLELQKEIDKKSEFSGSYQDLKDIPQLKAATQTELGSVKAATKTELDTVPVKIGADEILYVPSYPMVYMTQEDKNKLDEFLQAANYALKSDLTTVYRYKGTLENESFLPSIPQLGDTYNLTTSSSYGNGANVAWNGTEWDNLGASIDLSPYLQKAELEELGNTEIDAIWNTVFGS